MATHSSVLAWRMPGTGKPGGVPSMGSQRVGRLKRLSSNNGVIALSAAPTKSLWNLRNPSPLLTHPVEMPLIPAPPPQKLPSQDAPFLISIKIFSANPIPQIYTDHALNQRGILSVTPQDPVSFPHSSSGASLKSGPNGHPQGSSPRSDTQHSIKDLHLFGDASSFSRGPLDLV